MTERPVAKTTNIVVRSVDQETLVYNLSNDECFCLEGSAGLIWSMSDGTRTVDDLMAACGLRGREGRDIVLITLEQLRAKGLIEPASLEGVVDEFKGMSRRAMLRKVGLAATAVPLVSAILAPTPGQAQSGCVGDAQPCTIGSTTCCAGLICVNTESGPTSFQCLALP